MKSIVIGSDHAGFDRKSELLEYLKQKNYTCYDCGCYDLNSVDYPDYAKAVAGKVSSDTNLLGILLCGSGIGVSIVANRWKGIRAALCWDIEIARLSRQHNDANIICLPARFLDKEKMIEIVNEFLNTEFEGGRHLNRIRKIDSENE